MAEQTLGLCLSYLFTLIVLSLRSVQICILGLDINSESYMGIWIADTEGAKFWLFVLIELHVLMVLTVFLIP